MARPNLRPIRPPAGPMPPVGYLKGWCLQRPARIPSDQLFFNSAAFKLAMSRSTQGGGRQVRGWGGFRAKGYRPSKK